MQAVFADNWLRATARLLDGNDYFPELKPVGDHLAQVFKSSPRESTESVRLMYLLSFAAARKNIRIAVPYFVPGPLTVQELVDACLRGVRVEIIVPGARTDAAIVRHASRAKWGPLLAAGVKIYEYEPTMYHCKMMVVDDVWVSVGSANFDNRSFRLNDEANLNVFAADFATAQARVFEADKAQSREVTYHDWKERSFWKRFEEILAAPFRTQL
jgi:cardiolipin synthase